MNRWLHVRAILFLSFFFSPVLARAHERWFTESIDLSLQKPDLFSRWSTVNASTVALAVLGFFLALGLHRALGTWCARARIVKEFARFKKWVPTVLRTMTGLLLFTASFQGFLFAPDLIFRSAAYGTGNFFSAVQLIIGLALVIGCVPRVTAACGLALYVSAFFFWPFISVVSYIGLVGIFLYTYIIDGARSRTYAMPLLRIFMGAGFMIAGAYYKIIQPAYALAFLEMHSINFMPALGFDFFTDEMFVLAAGFTETFVGLLVVIGILPRLLGAVLFLLFSLTLLLFGPVELLGHLPLFAFAFALMVEGAGAQRVLR